MRLMKEQIPDLEVTLSEFSSNTDNTYQSMKTKDLLVTPISSIEIEGIKINFVKNEEEGQGDSNSKNPGGSRSTSVTLTSTKPSDDIKKFIQV